MMKGESIAIGSTSSKNRDNQPDLLKRPSNDRQRTMSSNWVTFEQKPFWVTSFMVDHPFLIHFVMLCLATGAILISDRDILSDMSLEMVLPDRDFWTDGYFAHLAINKKLQTKNSNGHPQSMKDGMLAKQIFFEQVKCDLEEDPLCDLEKHPWILTPSNLKTIIEYEDMIENHPRWQDTCFLARDVKEYNDCGSSALSPARMLRDALGGWDSPQMTTMGLKGLVHQFLGGSPALAALFDPMVSEGLALNVSDMKAKHYRALFYFGTPFPTEIEEITAMGEVQEGNETVNATVVVGYEKSSEYSSAWDRPFEQRDKGYYTDFLWDFYRDWDFKHNGDMVDGNLRINTFTQGLWMEFFNWHNMHKAWPMFIAAATIVTVYATYDIGSFFLPAMALWEVIITMPFTWFIYNTVFGVEEFVHVQIAVLFLLFSVGVYYYPALVFVDHWLHTAHSMDDPNDYRVRMACAWKQAAAGAGVAQSTTFVSFLSSVIGTVLMFKAFGLFAALAIGVNYLMGITLFPCSIIIWELYVRQWEFRLGEWMRANNLGICAFGIHDAFYKRFQTETRSSKKGQKTENWKQEFVDNYQRGVVNIGFGDQNIEELKDDYRNMGVFMGVHWIAMLHKLWVKIGIVVIALAWLVVAFAGMLSIKPLEENENFTGEHTFLMKSLHGMQDFAPMKNEIRIMFGVKGLADRRIWHADDFGIVDYYDNVGFHTEAQQTWMLEYCEMLRSWRSKKNEESLIKIDENVNCVFEKFRDYILSSESGLGNGSANASSYPLLKPDVSDDSDDQREFYLEHLYEWYHNSASGVPERNAYRLDIERNSETYVIKTARAFVESEADFWSLQSEADHEEARFREFMADSRIACEATLEDANDPLCNPTITSARWSWSEGYQAYWDSAKGSILFAFPIIFVILMIVLNNYIMAILCCINVCCIMISVLGVIGMVGWRFGLTECASVILVIGFSVDYCVHISHGYIVAPLKHNREVRCQFALLQNGHAILSSATISILSTIPVLTNPGEALIWKMGLLTVGTIIMSVIFTFTTFTLMMATIAPEGDGGKLWGRGKQQVVGIDEGGPNMGSAV